MNDLIRECTICHRNYEYKRSKGHRTTKCNSCCQVGKRRSQKAKFIAYKGGKCQDCGYNKSQRALSFHHRDPKTKKFTISSFPTISWEKLKEELNKCDLLCANCHMEREESQACNSTEE